jgi:hypothetical protein
MEQHLLGSCTRAKDELEVARHLLQHAWKYEDLFRALRISLKEVDELSPDTLLQAIDGSYMDARNAFSVYLLPIPPEEICNIEEARVAARDNRHDP